FTGLSGLESITMSGVGLEHLFEHQFDDLQHLSTLDLSRNALSEFPDRLLQGGPIRTLDLSHNRLVNFPRAVLTPPRATFRFPERITLEDTRITALPDTRDLEGPASERDGIQLLNLSHNAITSVPLDLCRFFAHDAAIDLTADPVTEDAVQNLRRACPRLVIM